MKRLLLISIVSSVLIASGHGCLASPIGLWLAKDGGKIRIEPCGQYLCGFIAQTKTGGPLHDIKNPDPVKRHRALGGLKILISMQKNGPSKWSGELYNDADGQTYSGNLIELNASTIRIEGCWLMLCGGENLTRLTLPQLDIPAAMRQQ